MNYKIRLASFIIIVFVFLFAGTGNKDKKYIAVTFDDLPAARSQHYSQEQLRKINVNLLEKIKKYDVPAIGFVNENKLYVGGKLDSSKVSLLKLWLEAGLDLGNHTYSHIDLHSNTLKDFEKDFLKGEKVTRKLLKEFDKTPEYFRHPYLHAGRSMGLKDSLNTFLNGHGYKIAPVTIDNSDWIFARAYDIAFDKNDSTMMKKIGNEYVDYMMEKIKYFERQSEKLLGYQMKEILLVHDSFLNSDYFGKFAERMKDSGYDFISLKEALKDKAYQKGDQYTGYAGISWMHRWAIAAGKKNDFFEGEPTVPKPIMNYAGVESE